MTQNPWGPTGGKPASPQRDPDEDRSEGIRFTDNRKVDPETLQPRVSTPAASDPAPAESGEAYPRSAPTGEEVADGAEAQAQPAGEQPVAEDQRVAELTADLQRLSAEYANYRKRVDRDRELNRDRALAAVVTELLPILDDIDRARGHGELDAGFKAVGDALDAVAAKFGMERFGEEGEPFDPHVHEAMTSQASADVEEPTVASVYQVGYRLRDQILRPARVAVVDSE